MRKLVNMGVTPELTATDAKHVRAANMIAIVTAISSASWILVNIAVGEYASGSVVCSSTTIEPRRLPD